MPHRFTKSTIHIEDQQGPPSPYVGEREYTVKMSSGTSKFTVGDAQKDYASDVSKGKVNPIKGDELTGAKWMAGKHLAELACLGQKNDKCWRNQCNFDLDDGRPIGSICHYC